jgi:predicted Na+-dependent transporter
MLLSTLKVFIVALIFAIGISTTVGDVTYLWQRPMLWVESIFGMCVVMPVVATVMAWTLPLPPQAASRDPNRRCSSTSW